MKTDKHDPDTYPPKYPSYKYFHDLYQRLKRSRSCPCAAAERSSHVFKVTGNSGYHEPSHVVHTRHLEISLVLLDVFIIHANAARILIRLLEVKITLD